MHQDECVSIIHIKVSSPEIWQLYKNIHLEEENVFYGYVSRAYANFSVFNFSMLTDKDQTSFILADVPFTMKEAKRFISSLAKIAGKDIIAIAEIHKLDSRDEGNRDCVYYLGDEVKIKRIRERYNEDTSILDLMEWLSYLDPKLTKLEEECLYNFGIVHIESYFQDFSKSYKISERVYLRETSYNKRNETIEKCRIGDEVSLLPAKDPFDPLRIEVISKYGSLGYLPSFTGEKLAPALKYNLVEYSAKVSDLTPLSKRNKHAKSSIVEIEIEGIMKKLGELIASATNQVSGPETDNTVKAIESEKEERARFLYESMIDECKAEGISIPSKVLDDIKNGHEYYGEYEFAAICIFAWVFVQYAVIKHDVHFPRYFLRKIGATQEEEDSFMENHFDWYYDYEDWYYDE